MYIRVLCIVEVVFHIEQRKVYCVTFQPLLFYSVANQVLSLATT